MYATRTRKLKTDRRDARALADACLLGPYRPTHRLSDPQRHVRGRLTVRDAVVRTRTRYIFLIRALLRRRVRTPAPWTSANQRLMEPRETGGHCPFPSSEPEKRKTRRDTTT